MVIVKHAYNNHSTVKSNPTLVVGIPIAEHIMIILTILALGTDGMAREDAPTSILLPMDLHNKDNWQLIVNVQCRFAL